YDFQSLRSELPGADYFIIARREQKLPVVAEGQHVARRSPAVGVQHQPRRGEFAAALIGLGRGRGRCKGQDYGAYREQAAGTRHDAIASWVLWTSTQPADHLELRCNCRTGGEN